MFLRKQDLNELDYNHLNGLTETELEDWCKQNKLHNYQSWLLPQLVANFGGWQLYHTAQGRPDILATLKHNIGHDPKQHTLYRLSRLTRSVLVQPQARYPQYAQLTPLILAGFRRMQGVEYEQWQGCENLSWILEPQIFQAVCLPAEVVGDLYSLGSDRLLEIRNIGLMNKSGAKVGQSKPADTTWSLTGIQDTELGKLPKLTQTILTQIWLAHPTKRTADMILDLRNWSSMPQPLLSGEVFVTHTAAQPQPLAQKLPWL